MELSQYNWYARKHKVVIIFITFIMRQVIAMSSTKMAIATLAPTDQVSASVSDVRAISSGQELLQCGVEH